MITKEKILAQLIYHPETGSFTRRYAIKGQFAGARVGTIRDGYRIITIDGKKYREHRLVWLVEKDVWPNEDLDHEDRNRSNNRIGNLREATDSQNAHNIVTRKSNNSSGIRGITWSKDRAKWQAAIKINNKYKMVGRFTDLEEAVHAMYSYGKKHLGEFYRLERYAQ